MSMISAQIDELRQMADGQATYSAARAVMLQAADTIWQLRDDLQRANAENARLREERDCIGMASYEVGYKNGSVHYELEHCPACKNIADLQEALEENHKLRELVCWMYDRMDESCAVQYPHAPTPISYDRLMQAQARARELGAEVDEWSEELKPCPFCGYEKPVVVVDEGYPRRAWVECPLCEAKGPTESIPCGMTEEEAAVDAWNDPNWGDA